MKKPGGIEAAYREMMRRIVDLGAEFPDASASCAVAYGVKVEELRALYDEEKPDAT